MGRYQLTAVATGFRTHSRSGITVELGRAARLDLALEVGQVTETVEVVGSIPLVESESSTVGQFIENKMVTDMPLNGRPSRGARSSDGQCRHDFQRRDPAAHRGGRKPRGSAAVADRRCQFLQCCT